MNKADLVAPEFSMQRSEATLDLPRTPSVVDLPLGGAGLLGKARGFVSRLTDTQLALAISAVLFTLSAWPLALTEVPPYQDLPNHLAAVHIIQNPDLYPEFAFNGFFKTNAALFTWLCLVGKVVGTTMAARLFTLLVLALNALVIPRFLLELTNRKKLVVGSFFVWPMIHNWFVSMGMLDFALGVPLSLLILVLLNRQRKTPSIKTAVAICGVAALTWYAHVFTLMVVHMLLAIHVVFRPSWRERIDEAKKLILPILPTSALMFWSLIIHATEDRARLTGGAAQETLIPLWEQGYNLWAEWFWGFTWLSISSLAPCVILGVLCIWRRNESAPFFSPIAFWALAALYFFLPYTTTNWFHVNSRIIPFLWMAALVRLPDRFPRRVLGLLGACAVLYSVGMGVDFVRLDKDRAKFTAGMSAVPERARLLPLVFRRQLTSENTRSLLHAWGFYAAERSTSAPLLFAHSRSFPVMYRVPPPAQFNHLMLEGFAPNMATAHHHCAPIMDHGVVPDDCAGEWRHRWAEFWGKTEPEFDTLLLWDASAEVKQMVPASYKLAFENEQLSIYRR